MVAVACFASGCAFFESAGEVTIGEEQIGNLIFDFRMPDYADFASERQRLLDGHDGIADGRSAENASMAHVMGIVALAGHCERVFVQQGAKGHGAASDLKTRILICPPSGTCDHVCQGRRGVIIEVAVDVLALDAETAVEIKSKVQQRVEDTLIGTRMRFDLVQPYHLVDGKRHSLMPKVHRLVVGASDQQGNRIEVLGDLHRDQLTAQTPVRATFDPKSPITREIVKCLEEGHPVIFKLDATLHVEPADAYEWPIFSSGFRLEVQPEFVISVLGGLT